MVCISVWTRMTVDAEKLKLGPSKLSKAAALLGRSPLLSMQCPDLANALRTTVQWGVHGTGKLRAAEDPTEGRRAMGFNA
jgi:hypothetical protein